jgi:Amt family ammonium transporter
VGWFGFNGGSQLAIDSRAVNAVIVTNLSASLGGLTWILTEMLWHRSRKMSLYGFCNGAVAGLVCITPASGYVSPASSLVFGALGKFVFIVNNQL